MKNQGFVCASACESFSFSPCAAVDCLFTRAKNWVHNVNTSHKWNRDGIFLPSPNTCQRVCYQVKEWETACQYRKPFLFLIRLSCYVLISTGGGGANCTVRLSVLTHTFSMSSRINRPNTFWGVWEKIHTANTLTQPSTAVLRVLQRSQEQTTAVGVALLLFCFSGKSSWGSFFPLSFCEAVLYSVFLVFTQNCKRFPGLTDDNAEWKWPKNVFVWLHCGSFSMQAYTVKRSYTHCVGTTASGRGAGQLLHRGGSSAY